MTLLLIDFNFALFLTLTVLLQQLYSISISNRNFTLHFTNELEIGCLGQDLRDLGLDGGDDQHAADGDHHSILTEK